MNEQEMILQNQGLVFYVAKKFRPNYGPNEIEDLHQIGMIGLLKAIRSFDGGRGTSFGSYATAVIQNEILLDLRQRRKGPKTVLFYGLEGPENSVPDESMDVEERAMNEYESGRVLALCQRLSEKEQDVVCRYYGLEGKMPMNARQIATIYGCSQTWINRIRRAAIQRIRKRGGY